MSTLLWLPVGCGSRPVVRDTIELDPVLVTGGMEEEDLAFASAEELFLAANRLLEEEQFAPALRRYRMVIEHFPDSAYYRAALYNSALCYEGLDDWQTAADIYSLVVERWPASRDATDALYRWADALSQLGRWEEITPLMERALRRTDLTLVDRIEAHLRWGLASLELRDYSTAERQFRTALRTNREAQTSGGTGASQADPALPDYHPMLVQTHFGLGRTYHELFSEIKLVLPESAIFQALLDKGQLAEQARLAYLDAVRAGNIYWSPAAGFMIGQLYEDFYLDVLACEVPHDFDPLTVEVYFDDLRAFLRPLTDRALEIYQETMSMSERLGGDPIWLEEAARGIERIRSYLEDPAVQAEQEEAILQQRHPHGARNPSRRWTGPHPPES
ncbi:MAG: tetratricopeptide repeat protein [Bradymonadales bacterium]|nr:tetratricopeptide repeat protein [Bradymonadales bacterium]